jgi:hypothetical protein
MQCTLNIPHLIPPREVVSVWQQLNVPALKTLLARARYQRRATVREFSSAYEFDGSAAAPLLAASDGLAADTGYWLCATPVHLETRRHALVLADPAALQLTPAESAALAAVIAEHVRGDNMTLHTPPSGRWYLRCDCDMPPAITTSPLDEAIGRDIQAFLPQGPDALRWHRLLTETHIRSTTRAKPQAVFPSTVCGCGVAVACRNPLRCPTRQCGAMIRSHARSHSAQAVVSIAVRRAFRTK